MLLQKLFHKDVFFFRIADERGWSPVTNPVDGSVLYEEVSGEIIEDQ